MGGFYQPEHAIAAHKLQNGDKIKIGTRRVLVNHIESFEDGVVNIQDFVRGCWYTVPSSLELECINCYTVEESETCIRFHSQVK